MRDASITKHDLQTLDDEVDEIKSSNRPVDGRPSVERADQDQLKLKAIQIILVANSANTQRRPSQRIGVLTPRGFLVDGPEPDERIELVGQRHRDRNRIGRYAVRGTERLVVLLHRGGDRGVLALQLGVFTA